MTTSHQAETKCTSNLMAVPPAAFHPSSHQMRESHCATNCRCAFGPHHRQEPRALHLECKHHCHHRVLRFDCLHRRRLSNCLHRHRCRSRFGCRWAHFRRRCCPHYQHRHTYGCHSQSLQAIRSLDCTHHHFLTPRHASPLTNSNNQC